ncbi:hypothetical protein Vadar_015105 [Vaccinium darrowii]|uniref:Uncharacterized protein n=1 Tax=Vaccinium darrowii TaxID=229202 RepID=A0ACB7YLN2_9ERIC|nr:hypothetical protein Vadar_015105 [Vaccinium darrowii]
MRIRKRFLLSSLSDPQLNRSPPLPLVQKPHQETHNRSQPSDSSPNQLPSPPPSDQNLLIRSAKASWVFSSRHKDMEGEEARDQERSEEGEKSNDTKKGNILDSGKVLVPLPPKKRRGSFEMRGGNNGDEKKKRKAKMKSKTNKKCVELLPKEDDDETNEGDSDGGAKKKKAKRGNVIMEGSRCSRVNGRGWRCCQQTLVGYSLCEHHLGKGRLRSIASVRNRATIAPKEDESARLSTFADGKLGRKMVGKEDEDEDEDDDEEEKPLMIRKKRMKIGMVKARSISSLLGQTNNAVVALNDSDKKSSVILSCEEDKK